MSEKRVFVTGSTGCIGAHAVGILLEEGCQVFGFNRKPPAEIPSGYEHLEGDLSDKGSIDSALQKSLPTHIYISVLCRPQIVVTIQFEDWM